jgi:5'-deoxynucleotidase YfbR-like HD superfamily hydrolase
MTVIRFHASPDPALQNSGDNIDVHQLRVRLWCGQICRSLGVEVSPDLDKAALNHDEAERILGDVPGPAKERFWYLRWAYAIAERAVLREMGLTWNLTRQENDILQLADKADAWLIACRVGAADDPEWMEAFAKLERMADKLGTDWLRDFALAAREGRR